MVVCVCVGGVLQQSAHIRGKKKFAFMTFEEGSYQSMVNNENL